MDGRHSCSLLAALTRVPGILLLLPLLVLYISRDGLRPTRDWIPLFLAPLAVGLFLVYLWTVTGDLLAPLHAQDYWRASGPNAEAVVAESGRETSAATMVISAAPPFIVALWVATIVFYTFLFVYFRHDRIGPAYWIVAALAIFGVFASGKLLSAPRYIVVAWPFDWVLANRESPSRPGGGAARVRDWCRCSCCGWRSPGACRRKAHT